MPKIRKDERKAEKLYKTLYGYQNQIKIEEKIEKFKDNMPDIKSKYELFLEQNANNNINNINENTNNEIKEDKKPVNDWWGDIFK